MKNSQHYCSACLKPCEVITRHDSIDHAHGRYRFEYDAPACHPDDNIISRREAVTSRWNQRHPAPRVSTNLHPIFQEILDIYVRRQVGGAA